MDVPLGCFLLFLFITSAIPQTIVECQREGGSNLNVFCGRGSSGQCPGLSYCDIHPTDAFATCCCNIRDACPNCTRPVSCLIDPCTVGNCLAYTGARCEADYCGGCNARFYTGDVEVTDKCDMPIQPCQSQGGRNLNIYCGLGSSGECPTRSYCDVHPTDVFASCCCNDSAAICPNCTYPVYCFANPCQFANCRSYPSARCEADYCGGCNARFYMGDIEVTDRCDSPIHPCQRQGGRDLNIYCGLGSSGECPTLSYCDIHPTDAFASCCCNDSAAICPNCTHPVNCFADPCQFASCNAYPSARCEADYCGGCNARFHMGDKEVTDQCNVPIEPCHRQGGRDLEIFCGRGSTGECPINSYCDIEPADDFATCCCNDSAASCPDCTKPVNCLVSPCTKSSCTAFPEAECRENYCGGCDAQYFVGETEVTKQCSAALQCASTQQCSQAPRVIAYGFLLILTAVLAAVQMQILP